MSEIPEYSHSEMMKLKANKKTLHRRTQSNTAFDMNFLVQSNTHNPELMSQIVQSYHIMNGE